MANLPPESGKVFWFFAQFSMLNKKPPVSGGPKWHGAKLKAIPYTANILPVPSASFTCVLIVHCKLHRNTTCTTNILTLPIKLYWYDQWFYCIHAPNKTLVIPVKNNIATNKIYWQYKLKTLAIPLKNNVPTNEKYW